MPYKKFFIIGLGRTGTTQLLNVFSQHPEMRSVVYEPTNFGNESVVSCLRRASGIKEIVNKNNSKEFIAHAMRLPLRFIRTKRRNILRQSISMYLAAESGVWQWGQKTPKEYIESVKKFDLSLEMVSEYLRKVKIYDHQLDEDLKYKNYYTIMYEDFYFGSDEFQEKCLIEMFDFIGLNDLSVNPLMKYILDSGRLNNEEVYASIKNAKEIDHEFGSEENGWLFDAR